MTHYEMACKLVDQDMKWLHEENDPTACNGWLELLLLEGFKGYLHMTTESLQDELDSREDPIDETVDDIKEISYGA